jgi:hypothetical protein
VTREQEAFMLRGQETALSSFSGTYMTMLTMPQWKALRAVSDAQLRLAHALTLPPTRFKRG